MDELVTPATSAPEIELLIVEVERMAEAIHRDNPVTIYGEALEWDIVVSCRPDRAAVYREAASNRIRAAEAMRRLDTLETQAPRSDPP